MSAATCKVCGRSLPASGARLVIDYGWVCPDCALLAENPTAQLASKPPPAVPLETYELFSGREYTR